MISQLARWTKRIFLGVFSLLTVYILLALTFSLLGTAPDQYQCENQHTIYVASNGVHLDIILPVNHQQVEWMNEIELAGTSQYLSFGWGDREFYINTPQWKDLKFKTTFNAVLLNSEAALHVTGHPHTEEHWIAVMLCDEQLTALTNYIKDTFKVLEGRFMEIPLKGYSSGDVFYEAHGSFNLFNTCNHWVNQGLRAAKVKTSIWSPFDFGVMYHLRHRGKSGC